MTPKSLDSEDLGTPARVSNAVLVPEQEGIRTQYLEYMPLSLHNTIRAVQSPPWFQISGTNQSDQVHTLRITFEVIDVIGQTAPVAEKPRERLQFTIKPRQSFEKKLYPSIEILNFDIRVETPLRIQWAIMDENEKILDSDFVTTVLLPKDILKWDLNHPDGRPVDKRFLFASMAAWALDCSDETRECARDVLVGIDKGVSRHVTVDAWISQCYTYLFQPLPDRIHVSDTFPKTPALPQQSIRTVREVLRRRQATPLEVPLLIRALSVVEEVSEIVADFRMVLFLVPDAHAPGERQEVWLGWYTPQNGWRALNAAEVNAQSYEENENVTSLKLTQLLDMRKEVLRDIDSEGVFMQEGQATLALDFARARQKYGFWGLP